MLRWFNIRRIVKCSQYSYSTVNPSITKLKTPDEDKCPEEPKTQESSHKNVSSTEQSRLVAAAFASLKEIQTKKQQKPVAEIDKQINAATDINSLLVLVDGPFLPKHHALKIVSVLANWASMGKITLADFQTDIRFAKLCRILGRAHAGSSKEDMGDLSVVLGVTADDQAAKLISSISLQQMIKVLSSLSLKKRRSTPLLRSLAFNIGRADEKLDIKEASDVFYAAASLNYPDEVLLEKVCDDIRICLKDNKKSAVVNSIVTSMGILRYRDSDLLNQLCLWFIENSNLCRTKDFLALLLTLASVNYLPESFSRFYKILKPSLKESEMKEINTWVDVVWSLVVLKQYDKELINSVLEPAFISKLMLKEKDLGRYFKLLNINGVAKQLGSAYKGSFLEDNSSIFETQIHRSKEKQHFFNSVMETISNLVKIEDYFQIDVNSKSGFLIDAVCLLDSKRNFVKFNSEESENTNTTKVAIMTCIYHDFCRGCHYELTGINAITHRLLSGMGYQILSIPYNEYTPQDKLMHRMQYLSGKLKESVQTT